MSRKYTSKETKDLIAKHSENIKKLELSSLLPSKYAVLVKNCVNDMFANDVFEQMVMQYVKGYDSDDKALTGYLIKNLYLFKRAARQSAECKNILQANKCRILETIKTASSGSNVFSWLFSSSNKKLEAETAYESLEREISGSYYWLSSQKILSDISENDGITVDESLNDFNSCIQSYYPILKKIIPGGETLSKPISEFRSIIHKYDTIAARLEKETSRTDEIKEKIEKSAERMVMSAVFDLLKTVPVEEINRDKKGFRVKSLRDSGYTTIADVYAASPVQLSTVYGISEDASYSIKNIAKKIAIETRRNAKIRLSVDNKTKEATNLVSGLLRYRKYSAALVALEKLKSDYDDQINKAIKYLEAVNNGVFWIFYDQTAKESVKKSFDYLVSVVNGDYSFRADKIIQIFGHVDSFNTGDAWEDFKRNPIPFFNILETVVPGVLGNDDQLYGLPEDLAREIQEECFFPDGLNCELRRYQEWGVKYILHQERVLLGDEMGLGKTVQAIATMVSLRNTGASHFIVVCPASVLPNWCKEISTKSKLRATKVHGAGRTQAIKSWLKTGGVAVTTYETTGIFKFDESLKFDLLVVDEAHFIKNIKAVRSRNVRQLAAYTKRMLFMTGTALENKVDEMVSLIEVLQPDVAMKIQNITFMAAAPQFREKISGVYYRRKREDVLTELPDLIDSREWCELSGEELKIYERDVLKKNSMGVRRLSWNVDNLDQSCKARRMMEIIEEAESEGRKVLIFSFFLDTIRKIYSYLGNRCCNPINGSIPPQRRQEIIDQFNEDPEKTVLCAQIQSGGTGLNIQAASVVIICEPQFKPSIENQAISRAYRMGQARNVLVYHLLCEDTVDERISNILDEKQRIFDAFADKSVAASKTSEAEKEMDTTTFGKIIEEEIERINEKNGIVHSGPKDESMLKETHAKRRTTKTTEVYVDLDFKPESALTSSEEYAAELEMDYGQLVRHLLRKYGNAKYDYFLTETCASKNRKVSRTEEGLLCHHIDEDKAIMLSDTLYALNNPFEYQRADRLVYCNILEHLILHVKIVETPRNEKANKDELPGIGGAVNFITKQINDYYNGYDFRQQYIVTVTSYIKDNFEDYIKILKHLISITQHDVLLSTIANKESLACDHNDSIVKKVYNRIC